MGQGGADDLSLDRVQGKALGGEAHAQLAGLAVDVELARPHGHGRLHQQVLSADDIPVRHQHGPLHHVLQLPHVARQRGAAQSATGRLVESLGRRAVERRVQLQVVLGEQHDVVLPLPQGRHGEGDDVEPVVEVLAEAPFDHQPLQVGIGGGEETHAHFHLLRAADPAEAPRLEDGEQLGLQVDRHETDLVEEQGAPVGDLDQALAAGAGVGEGAGLVTEELCRHQVGGDVRAVEGDEGPVADIAVEMDRPGDHLLARAALAADEDGGAAGGDAPHHAEDLLHGRAAADHALQLLDRRGILLRPLQQGFDLDLKLRQRGGLGEVGGSAELSCLGHRRRLDRAQRLSYRRHRLALPRRRGRLWDPQGGRARARNRGRHRALREAG